MGSKILGERIRIRGVIRYSFLLRPMLYTFCAMLVFGMLGCQGTITKILPPLEEEGEVYLYLQSYPQEAERLRFTLEGAFAVNSEGREFPLETYLREIKPADVRRQRLLAYGRIPAGTYTGFSFKVNKAKLKGEEGEADLLVPEKPVLSGFNFNVNRKTGYVFFLNLKYRESIEAGFNFSPVFSIFVPGKPTLSVLGYVSNSGSSNLTAFD